MVARMVPFYEFDTDDFFCSDGAPADVATRRQDGFFRLARLYGERYAKGREMTAELASWSGGRAAIKSWSRQTAVNLWRVPGFGLREWSEESGTGRYWISRLAELRKEFEYAVIEGPAAGISSEAALLGQLSDGIILVLGAHSTRRAAARKIKETLEGEQSRLLGTVLSERRFPIPERIYRRL